MTTSKPIFVVTGAAGFIGSCLMDALLERYPDHDIIAVDDFSPDTKRPNHANKRIAKYIHREVFTAQANMDHGRIKAVFHLGARTDTTEKNTEIFDRLNLGYTKDVWRWCITHDIPLIYASSAATYGGGEHGYHDRHDIVPLLQPLNPYGRSKNDFDIWALRQENTPPHWYGLKFFNVYGPNEYHKGRMASVIFHAFNQIRSTGKMRLFQSHRSGIENGLQMRDFIYVKDVVDMCLFFYEKRPESGLYNIGTGKARSFLDLVRAVFSAMDRPENIDFIPIPEDIRDTYQYFTEADMSKLTEAGYEMAGIRPLEEGIHQYVQDYLLQDFKIL